MGKSGQNKATNRAAAARQRRQNGQSSGGLGFRNTGVAKKPKVAGQKVPQGNKQPHGPGENANARRR